jgi:hypothetical protein
VVDFFGLREGKITVEKNGKTRKITKAELRTYKQMGWEEVKEARKYTPPTKDEIEADKKKDRKGKTRSSMDAKSAKKSVYKNMMGGLRDQVEEEVELEEAYTKQQIMKMRQMLGREGQANKKKGIEIFMDKVGVDKNRATAMWKAAMNESVELDEAKKEVSPKDVEDYLVKTGVNPKDAKDAVKKGFSYANKKYGGPTHKAAVKKIADVVWSLHEEMDEPASPDEKGMAMDQAKFIKYVGDEIMEYLNNNNEFPEWMQNKLSALHEKAKGLHATMAGKYNESAEIEESSKEYGKSQEKMADKEKNDKISSSDKKKLAKLAALMAKEMK